MIPVCSGIVRRVTGYGLGRLIRCFLVLTLRCRQFRRSVRAMNITGSLRLVVACVALLVSMLRLLSQARTLGWTVTLTEKHVTCALVRQGLTAGVLRLMALTGMAVAWTLDTGDCGWLWWA